MCGPKAIRFCSHKQGRKRNATYFHSGHPHIESHVQQLCWKPHVFLYIGSLKKPPGLRPDHFRHHGSNILAWLNKTCNWTCWTKTNKDLFRRNIRRCWLALVSLTGDKLICHLLFHHWWNILNCKGCVNDLWTVKWIGCRNVLFYSGKFVDNE